MESESTNTPGEFAELKATDSTLENPEPKTKMSRTTLFVLIMIPFLAAMGLTIVWPILPFIVGKYVSNPDDLASTVGWLASIYAICQFIAAPALGILSDRYGRRPLLLFCLIGSMLGYLIFGIGGALWVLILSRIIDGLTGGDFSVLAAYVSDLTEPEERTKFFGYFGASAGVGFIVGPVIGGFAANFGYNTPVFVSAALTAIIVLLSFFFLPESLDQKYRLSTIQPSELNPLKQLKDLLYTNGLRMIILLSVLYSIPFVIIVSNLSVLAIDSLNFDPANIGLLFLVIGTIDIVVQGYLIGKLLPIFGERKILVFGFVMQFISYALIASVVFITTPSLLFVGIIFYAISSGLIEPSIAGLISRLVSPEKQGVVQGSNAGLRSLISVIGPIGGGFMYAQLGHASPYLMSCAVMLIAAGMVLVTIPTLKGAEKPSAPLDLEL
jgi:DHA1 family tetracycline resistance protein-like MFS transporter